MKKLNSLTGPMRIPFLMLTPCCVFLSVSSAIWTSGEVNPLYVVLVFIAALAAHVCVNTLNEYYDFKSGLDYKTIRTPFSGGSGTLPAMPEKSNVPLVVGGITFLLVVLVGLFFSTVRGFLVFPLGILGLGLVVTYTIWIARIPFLSLIAPGMGFGILMVMGSVYVLTGEFTWTSAVVSFVPFFLVNNLLLLNQFPDVEADEGVGRRNYPIVIGKKASSMLYTSFLLFAYLAICLGVFLKQLPTASLLGLLTLIIAIPTVRGVFRFSEDTRRLIPYLGFNVLINLLTPVLLGVGFLLA